MSSNKVSRDKLLKDYLKGNVLTKCNYHYTDDYAFDLAYDFGESDYGLDINRLRNVMDFKSKSGCVWENNDGTINLSVHSNLCYTLKYKNTVLESNPLNNFQLDIYNITKKVFDKFSFYDCKFVLYAFILKTIDKTHIADIKRIRELLDRRIDCSNSFINKENHKEQINNLDFNVDIINLVDKHIKYWSNSIDLVNFIKSIVKDFDLDFLSSFNYENNYFETNYIYAFIV